MIILAQKRKPAYKDAGILFGLNMFFGLDVWGSFVSLAVCLGKWVLTF